MNNYHIIEVKYLGPTNTKGSRIKLTSSRFNQSVTIPYDYRFNNASDIAVDWLKTNGHPVIGCGEVKSGNVVIVDAFEHQFAPLKAVKE